ncbi:hypothetical protein [Bowmanella yangjiangensis]|uniref:Transposase n=1 Tax=Bowmanella yangjiangensis TaxID=2811230 RepID=A0ABS3CQD5_9ALTE|nr:hypothetical protein [Bowmanella yangjiangensis]MBN7818386.1 hypothetical protein [Bowmanella yangjiangensis]
MNDINKHNQTLMRQYGISTTYKQLYWYKQYCYEKLQDAINYARLDTEHDVIVPASPVTDE